MREEEEEEELCYNCNVPTGHAGKDEDSLYVKYFDYEYGPFCLECFEEFMATV